MVCGEEVDEDWCNTGFLTDDPKSPLHEFNYLPFHRRHIRQWEHHERMRKAILEFEASDAYEGTSFFEEFELD